MPFPFPCSPVSHEWLWKKTQIEKKSKEINTYLPVADIEHLQTCKLNSRFPLPLFPHREKKADLMFQNIFSNMMMVTIQVTSTLQAVEQWIIYFSFLMVFTGWECVNSFWTLFRMGGGGSAKRFLPSFHQHSWLLVLIILPHSCKISGPYQSQIIELETRNL